MKKAIHALVVITLLSCSGCSMAMALSGEKDVKLSDLRMGMDRGAVIQILGTPKGSEFYQGYNYDLFEVVRGNKPSALRALGHGMANAVSLGMWEIFGTSIEASTPRKQRIIVAYDEFDRVVNIDVD
jgi:outer membrane protein assembly factor BamE (lipoprotein component of BamABCDE complex)